VDLLDLGLCEAFHALSGTLAEAFLLRVEHFSLALRENLQFRVCCLTRDDRKASYSLRVGARCTGFGRRQGFEPAFWNDVATFSAEHIVLRVEGGLLGPLLLMLVPKDDSLDLAGLFEAQLVPFMARDRLFHEGGALWRLDFFLGIIVSLENLKFVVVRQSHF
jgi:hypothetical protein